ncbi:biliverdin-producing heme oxygenase [Acuticoccus sp. MNP-M23]|uniref:biliverdin-producing heme oxygenase n=1 Tax=Acuticoccus sp. MNP-M23 TaxID=3072793 RepID=UPI002815F001|nr:biliverdin-producing heme oxygenase [Acuticoccus sp. MNP-M23]WMS42788.1 biliverdin-producing heme oxygenase [Acuticoccus sp. MNP-M23]
MTSSGARSNNSVRHRLRAATEDLHQGLHRHPLLSRLLAADLTIDELRACAAVSFAAIEIVEAERARRAIWPELSLADRLSVLRMESDRRNEASLADGGALIEGEPELLGALYVVHGSAIGGGILFKRVGKLFPEVARSVFQPQDPAAWKYLCTLIESLPEAVVERCVRGATTLFNYYRKVADFHTEHV